MKGKIINENEYEILSRFYELKLDENNTLIEFSYNKDKVMSALKYKGFFVIITSYATTAAQAYTEYHSRDYTEKMIMMMKTNEQFDVCRVHDEEHLIGKTLAMFVGLILRNELYLKTRELRKKLKIKNCIQQAIVFVNLVV